MNSTGANETESPWVASTLCLLREQKDSRWQVLLKEKIIPFPSFHLMGAASHYEWAKMSPAELEGAARSRHHPGGSGSGGGCQKIIPRGHIVSLPKPFGAGASLGRRASRLSPSALTPGPAC